MVTHLKKIKAIREIKHYILTLPRTSAQTQQRLTGHPVFANGIPKCGTHLLERLMFSVHPLVALNRMVVYFGEPHEDEKLPRVVAGLRAIPKGAYAFGHVVPSSDVVDLMRRRNFRSFLIVRDPRDLVCSHITYVMRMPHYRFRDYFHHTLKNDDERLMASIKGIPVEYAQVNEQSMESLAPLPDIGTRYRIFTEWQDYAWNLTLRYEDLVGPRGGGDADTQLSVVRDAISHLGIHFDLDETKKIAENLYNPASRTFHKGQARRWRTMFTAEHKKAFKEVAGDLLIQLNYEKDYDW